MIRRSSSMSSSAQRAAGSLLLLLSCLTPACLSTRDTVDDVPKGDGACAVKCHGDGTSAAPPVDLDGNTDTSATGVGAHRRHLTSGDTHAAYACETCHVVPKTTEAPGHADTPRPAEVTFAAASVSQGANASYDEAAHRCATSYCHGGPGNFAWPAAAVWNAPKDPAEACGTSCHSLPPGGTHPKADTCENCHSDTAGFNHTIKNVALHINGKVEVKASGCNGCHGSDKNDAPPVDTSGSSDTTHVGVGAHQTHLSGGAFSVPVPCESCHVVPTDPGDVGHMDTALPAELTFSGLAAQDSSPAWDHDAATCSNTYCHGSADLGGSRPAPTWTVVDGTQAACGSCHALPPPAPHPQADSCDLCHDETAGPGQVIIDRNKHVDGIVQVRSMGCDSCHGSATNSAPPVDLSGSSSTSNVTVGAHQSHLSGGVFSRAVECVECHVVPASIGDPGHIDADLPAEVTFSGVATAGGASPVWTRGTATCTNAYCHGSTLPGGTNPAPTWTTVDGTQAACGACHSLPPPAPHVANGSCELCHAPTAGANKTIANRATHVNGTVDIENSPGPCNQCHGDATSPAPPKDIAGHLDTTFPGVGAHRQHLDATKMQYGKPLTCDVCHPVPPLSSSHINGATDFAFSGIATGTVAGASVTHVSTPVYGGAPAYSCAQVYCHGDWTEAGHPSGAIVPQPQWNVVDDSQAFCGSCHSIPPPTPHPPGFACYQCHPKSIDQSMKLNLDYHLNGKVDFQ